MAEETEIRISMPNQFAEKLNKVLDENGMTIEQAINFFLKWCIENPERMKKWYEENKYLLEEDDGLIIEIH